MGPYDPEEFVPERFLVENKDDLPTDPYLYAFGFGRRLVYSCPYLASETTLNVTNPTTLECAPANTLARDPSSYSSQLSFGRSTSRLPKADYRSLSFRKSSSGTPYSPFF